MGCCKAKSEREMLGVTCITNTMTLRRQSNVK